MFLSPVSFADGSVHYLPVSRTQSAPILVGPLQQASSPFRAEAAQPPAFSEAQDLLESSVPHCHSTAFAFLQSLALGDRVFSVSEPLAPAGNLSGVARVQSLSAAPLLPNALWNSGLWDIAAPTDGHAGFPLAPCLASPVDHDLTGVRRTTQVTPVPGTPAMNQERKAKTPPVQGYVYKDNVHGLERFVCTLQTGEVLDLLVEPSMEPQQFPSELWDSYAFYKNSRKTNRVCYEVSDATVRYPSGDLIGPYCRRK